MKTHLARWLALVVIFSTILAGCNYPGIAAPTPFTFPTPNQTLTAIFNPTATLAATLAAPTLALPTQAIASATLPVFTATLAPASTVTIAPPTNTNVPPTRTAVSYEGPDVRKGPSVVAYYQDFPVTIDGVFDEWNLDKVAVTSVVYGGNSWKGENDLSARVMFSWDEDNLYFAARVKDDIYVQEASGKDLFKGDSLEILFDSDVSGDYYLDEMDDDDYQLGISPGSPEPGDDPEAYLWMPKDQAGTRQKVKVGAMFVDDGYRVEGQVPWSVFNKTARRNRHFGFAFSISDNDRIGREVQETMSSNVPTRTLTDPTTWGDLTLSGTHAPSPGPTPPPSPVKRSGPSVEANYFSGAPSIDGLLGEWGGVGFELNQVVYGSNRWDGDSDLSGTAIFAWDKNYFYIAAKVVDDTYVQNARGEEIFMGDSLEVLFDADVAGDFYVRDLSSDDYQLGMSPGRPQPGERVEAYLWYPRSKEGSKTNVKIGAVKTDSGYNVEMAIPWSVLGVSPAEGKHFGFAFSVSDNDNPDRKAQQTMTSNVKARVLTDPTTWGDLVLNP